MKLLLLPLLLLVLVSCQSHSGGYGATPAPMAPALSKAKSERKIQKSGSMGLKSRSLKKSAETSIALVQTHRGILASSSLTEDEYEASIKVPALSLEPLMTSLKEVGKVTHQRVQMDDVTAQYLDLQAALKNKRALRDRLRRLLTEAKSVKDTLKIEKELTRVQTELDQVEGRMKLMQSKISYSTLSLSIERDRIPGPLGLVTKGVGWTFGKLVNLN